MPFLFISLLIISACSLNEEKDIQFIRHNLDDYYAETIPYKEKITFTLSTEKILNGIVVPIKIDSIHNTDVYVVKTFEKVNSINKRKEVIIVIGLDSEIRSDNGTVLSHFRLNDDNSYTTGNVVFKAFDENGELGDFGIGSGDHEGIYGQAFSYHFEKEDLIKRKELTFEISGFYLLNYHEK